MILNVFKISPEIFKGQEHIQKLFDITYMSKFQPLYIGKGKQLL